MGVYAVVCGTAAAPVMGGTCVLAALAATLDRLRPAAGRPAGCPARPPRRCRAGDAEGGRGEGHRMSKRVRGVHAGNAHTGKGRIKAVNEMPLRLGARTCAV